MTACQVVKHGDWYVMFYIGFRDERPCADRRRSLARRITDWQRHPANPIIRPGRDDGTTTPATSRTRSSTAGRWLLWYNGRHGGSEQIGLAIHEGDTLGFPARRCTSSVRRHAGKAKSSGPIGRSLLPLFESTGRA